MKKVKKLFKKSKGFTLIEMLVVVLIIGILAGIALPQYQMAVTKAKVAAILPIMRRWHDALEEYKLQHGDYNGTVDASWPSDWEKYTNISCGDSNYCQNDYWYCFANEEQDGYIYCQHYIDYSNGIAFEIDMYPSDYENESYRNKIECFGEGQDGKKACKGLGWKLEEEDDDWVSCVLN